MPGLFDPVTELVLSELSVLKLRVFCFTADNPETGIYLKDYEVDIYGRREVSSVKYYNIVSDLRSPIELRVFTDRGFSGVVLTPLQIRNHARLVFVKHRDYETTGKVLVKGIAKADLPKHYIGRRGFGKLLGRDACYNSVEMKFIVGSSAEATG